MSAVKGIFDHLKVNEAQSPKSSSSQALSPKPKSQANLNTENLVSA